MYTNFTNFSKLQPMVVALLLVLRSASRKDVSGYLEHFNLSADDIKYVIDKGLVKLIKGKKGDSDLKKLRLDKKGTAFLNSLSEPEIEEGDIRMFDYLCEMYLKSDDEERHVGNKKKTQKYCAEFRQKLDLNLHQMYWLCELFLKEFEHTKRLEYIFFNSNKNRYGSFSNNLEDSPLFQFYDENKERINSYWKLRIE